MSEPNYVYMGYLGSFYPVCVSSLDEIPALAKKKRHSIARIHNRAGEAWIVDRKTGAVRRYPHSDVTVDEATKMFPRAQTAPEKG